jgi:putative ubiquitin-RnfH superfamily antitoxin RatB of RatAB toxin-antitoxin module
MMHVAVAYAAPGVEALTDVALPDGAVVADAVAASGFVARFALAGTALAFAIHGQRARADTPLADGDRVELLRPLVAEPKDRRRSRARSRGRP